MKQSASLHTHLQATQTQTRPSTAQSASSNKTTAASNSNGAQASAIPTHLQAPGMQISPSAPADTQTATFQQVQGRQIHPQSHDQQEYIPYALPHLQQKAAAAAAGAALAAGGGPMSAPPTVTTFASPSAPGGKNSLNDELGAGASASPAKKTRQRRESAQSSGSAASATPRSSRQRAITSTGTPGSALPITNDTSGHKRKPSQNTLWQNSRAILGANGLAGGAAGSPTAIPASPVKPSVLNSVPVATPSPSRTQSAPVTNAPHTVGSAGNAHIQPQPQQNQSIQTPRRSVAVANSSQGGNGYYGAVPQSAPAHMTHYANYAPYQPSNLNPSPIHPSLLQQQQQGGGQVFAAPPYGSYTMATPQQQQQQQAVYFQHAPHTISGQPAMYHQTPMQDPQMHAQAAQYIQMTAPPGSSSMYTLHHPQGNYVYSPPLAHQMNGSGQVSQAGSPVSNAGSFVAPLVPQQQQDGSGSGGRNRSRSGLSRTSSDVSTFAPTLEHASASQQGMGGNSSSQDSSSLDTNLSISQPVPRARTTTAPANLQMLNHSTGSTGAGGEQDASNSAAELMLFLAQSPSPKAASRKVNINGQTAIGADLKGRRLFSGNSQDDLSSGMGEQSFSAQQAQFLQSAPHDMYAPPPSGGSSADEMASFVAGAGGHLQGPFEYTQYGMVGGGQPIGMGQDFGNW